MLLKHSMQFFNLMSLQFVGQTFPAGTNRFLKRQIKCYFAEFSEDRQNRIQL